jgi:RNA-binding protein YhbY
MSLKLSGAEKSRLRGRGQTMEAALKIGREGASPTVIAALDRLLTAHDLVKVRFMGADRDQRAILTSQLVEGTARARSPVPSDPPRSFYRPKAEVV